MYASKMKTALAFFSSLLMAMLTLNAAAQPDCVIIAPPDFIDVWQWYAAERANVKTNVEFAVVNTRDIYAAFPFGAGKANRNAAESIHEFIRTEAKKGTHYFVLGGIWINAQLLDAQGVSTEGLKLRTGWKTFSPLSLENAVPGIMAWPNSETGNRTGFGGFPSDTFYACTEIKKGTHPWDPDGDGWYMTSRELLDDDCDFFPSVSISRMSFKPSVINQPRTRHEEFYNFESMVTNYVRKLARGEAADFPGVGKAAAFVGNIKSLGDYDDMAEFRMAKTYGRYRPIKEKIIEKQSFGDAYHFIFDDDWDFVFYAAHGNGSSVFAVTPRTFSCHACHGLTTFIGGNISCFSGNVNSTTAMNIDGTGERFYPSFTIGEGAISNPFGGALVSVNNSFYGYLAPTSFESLENGLSDEILTYMTEFVFRDRLPIGEAWRKGLWKYADLVKHGKLNDDIRYVRSAMIEQMYFGDPLVEAVKYP